MAVYNINGVRLDKDGSTVNYDLTVKAIAHRGYSTTAPENTLPAYKLAKKKGFNFVECDVSFTSDGVPVLLHDNTITRTSNGTGNIGSLTFEQVRGYDFGSWVSSEYAGTLIPSFEEFIKLCRNLGLHPYIELKENGTYTQAQIEGLVDTVQRNGMKGKVTWISFSSTYLSYVKNYDADARLGYVVRSIDSSTITTANGLKTTSNEVFLDSSSYGSSAVQLCVEAGLPLEVWSVESISTLQSIDAYVTGATSNSIIFGKVLYDANIN